ncbi:hypothetical protein C481_21011 [Natrialba asiatica DSM 12278]|uniref:Uncharacterized protein n=1 Tax=Natrialba asiatica (strain ATCC 700177 / DSM 12278 / JCM 9576 / FERM P-10747 / NBRC 102637 / 172P1) TaxID=29540 RepID=M0AFD5_NATA1|nr:hypothetical protein C481_21011 [Natrialba asiatica DSM 12278]
MSTFDFTEFIEGGLASKSFDCLAIVALNGIYSLEPAVACFPGELHMDRLIPISNCKPKEAIQV